MDFASRYAPDWFEFIKQRRYFGHTYRSEYGRRFDVSGNQQFW
jgi:hypothetical protein